MHSDVSDFDEATSSVSHEPGIYPFLHEEHQQKFDMSPHFYCLDSNIDTCQDIPDITNIALNTYTSHSPGNNFTIPDHVPNTMNGYTIMSLDDFTSTTDIPAHISSESSSPESLESLSPSITCLNSPASISSEPSVASRLKSVPISRQDRNNDSSSSSQDSFSSPSTIHNYSTPNLKRKFRSDKGIPNENRDTYSLNSALTFLPCAVCGGTASGLHYGVNSCEPCKGFFTRYLRKKDEYRCTKYSNCPITSRLRGNCSSCRLKKCLILGMSRKNSRLGRYSLSMRMETIMKVKELESKLVEKGIESKLVEKDIIQYNTTVNVSQDNNMNAECCGPLKKGEQYRTKQIGSFKGKAKSGYTSKLVKDLVVYMDKIKPYGEHLVTDKQIRDKLISHYETYQLKINLFGNLKSIPKDEYFNLLKVYGIEIDKRMMFLKQSANEMIDIIERYCNFAKQIPKFKLLSSRDQSNLLKCSRYDFFMILMHEGYLHDEHVFLAHNGVAFHSEEVADKFFSRKLVINVCDMYHRLQNLKLSKEEKTLLIAISLVFTDRCSLENTRLVEQIQFSLTELLQRQLAKSCASSAFRRFTKIIDCLTTMRDSSELYLKEYKQLCQDEMVIEAVPIMTELLFEDT